MLTPERRRFIAEIANDEWIDLLVTAGASDEAFDAKAREMERLCERFVAEATDPDELHHFAERWNGDGGTETIRSLVRNPACDRGTALMVYWLAQPEFYLQYASRGEVPEHAHDGYDLVTELEGRLLAGEFATSRIAYDPLSDGLMSGSPVGAVRDLPPAVYTPVTG